MKKFAAILLALGLTSVFAASSVKADSKGVSKLEMKSPAKAERKQAHKKHKAHKKTANKEMKTASKADAK